MDMPDIGEVKFHVTNPPRADFRTFQRLQRLMLAPPQGKRHHVFAFVVSALLTWIALELAGSPDSALLVIDDGAHMIDAPWLWLIAIGLFLLGAATVYIAVLTKTRRVARHVYDRRYAPIHDVLFGERGMQVRWGATVFTSPWSVLEKVHEEKGITYLVAKQGISMAFTAGAFASTAQYQAWAAFIGERQRASAPA